MAVNSLKQLNKDILVQVGEEFGVEFKEDATKKEMLDALAEDGVTFSMYKEAFPSVFDQETVRIVEDDADKPSGAAEKFTEEPKRVLVKMTRANGSYEIRGYTFTKAHPFLPVSEEDAVYLTEEMTGFKIANPREVEEFYS